VDGDRCLAQTIPFMMDAMNNLELVEAVASCDAGRAWEATKVCSQSAAEDDCSNNHRTRSSPLRGRPILSTHITRSR
jgi:hypothetical protein